MKIGIFGGTFDPVHEGHIVTARNAREQFCLNRVIFVPARLSPHKISESPWAEGSHRLQMLELAIQMDFEFEVSDVELKRDGPSYTIDTLRAFKQKYPNDQFFLILGADSYRFFSTWKEVSEIERLAHCLVAPRPGSDFNLDASKASQISMKNFAVSSSELRTRLSRGENIGESLISGDVLKYIRDHRLYERASN